MGPKGLIQKRDFLGIGGIHEKIDFLNSSQNRYFFLYMPARQYIRIMPKWGLITRLGSKVMSIAVNSFLLVPDLHDSHAFFRFLVFLFCSLNY